MADLVLNVDVREKTGTGAARVTRAADLVPGVLYGGDKGPVPISLRMNELKKALSGGGFLSKLVKIDHKGERQPVIVRDVQFHPVSSVPVHLDLYRVTEDQIIAVEIPVHFANEEKSPGLKRGGALNVVRHTIEVHAPAGAIPDQILIDLSGLDIGDSVHISAISLPANVTPTITDRDFTIVTLTGAMADPVEEEEVTDEEEGAEPELVGKDKDDEDGDDAKADDKDT